MDQDRENLASLKIIRSEDESLMGSIIALEKPYIRLGRAAENDVILPDDKSTSRFHAAIEQREGSFYVVDLASTNGTFLRGIKLLPSMPELLRHGDVIQIGETTLRFEATKGYPGTSTASESPVFSRTNPGDTTTDTPPPAPASIPQISPPAPEPTEALRDEVSFTAIYPRRGIVERWYTILVYAHLLSAIDDVHRDAQRFKDQIQVPKEVTSSSSTPIARGTDLTIIPSCHGVVFNPERITVKWMENYHRAEFRLRADSSLAYEIARGTINIYVGPIIVGSINFTMPFRDTDTDSDREERSRMYHQEEIFVSYSHKDSDVVLACKNAYDALGFNVLIDRDTLRSGQVWNQELMRMVDRATIFQLFWSENSRQSKYCRQEWEHALKQDKGGGFIRPVYWEIPMPEPPEELSRYHFEYLELLPKRNWWSSLFKQGR